VKFGVKAPNYTRIYGESGRQLRKNIRAAAVIATDRSSKEGQRAVQERIRSVGLGRLSNAVGQTSTRKERDQASGRNPYGVIYARGGDESLAGGALESYSKGAVIVAQQKQWLAFATNAVPKYVSISGRRFRTTPELYKASRLASSIGKLVFRPIGPGRAVLVIQRVTLSPKTGQAKAAGPRAPRTRIAKKEVIAFILIRVTRRAARFDKDSIMRIYAERVPVYMSQALVDMYARGKSHLMIQADIIR
jgi:hypothetical protein